MVGLRLTGERDAAFDCCKAKKKESASGRASRRFAAHASEA
jgi:hypothetical protein